MAGASVPPGVDARIASPARIYDYMLGGHDNYQVDRDIGDQMIKLYPEAQLVLLENRKFLKRAVRHLAEDQGLRRFLDIGSGLPTQENVHEVAERHAPGSRIVYVDNDQMVLTHAHALLRGENVVTSTTDTIQREYQRRASADLTLRDLEPIKDFFTGLDLVDPGVTWVWDWRPDGTEGQVPGMYGGVARKP